MENKANTIPETQHMMRSIKKMCKQHLGRQEAEAMLEEIIAGRLAKLMYKINPYIYSRSSKNHKKKTIPRHFIAKQWKPKTKKIL